MSQNEKILTYMRKQGGITAMDALKLCGCFRLSARIHDLRRDGHRIVTETVRRNNSNFAQYWLMEDEADED